MKGTDRKNCRLMREVPAGLGRALAQNNRARAYYAGLSSEERQTVVTGAQNLRSVRELEEYVEGLGRPFE